MIYTLTLNPAIDRTLYIQDFDKNKVNRIEMYREDPGGKGINVSKMIYQLEGESIAVMITGGYAGEKLEAELNKGHINFVSFKTNESTRTNLKLVDTVNHTFTDINEAGPTITKELLDQIEAYLEQELKEDDILVLAGSIPKGVATDIYYQWCTLCHKKGVKVILDADQQALKTGLQGKPYMIKPNQEELENYFGVKFDSDEALVTKAKELIDQGVSTILVSQGVDGCILITEEFSIKFDALKVKVKSTVGAGDSMVAAIAFGLDQMGHTGISAEKFADIVALGVASSSASIECEGTIMGSKDRIYELKTLVTYKNMLIEKMKV